MFKPAHPRFAQRLAVAVNQFQSHLTESVVNDYKQQISNYAFGNFDDGLQSLRRTVDAYQSRPWWQRLIARWTTPIQHQQKLLSVYYASLLCKRLAKPNWQFHTQADELDAELALFQRYATPDPRALAPLYRLCHPRFNLFGWRLSLSDFVLQNYRSYQTYQSSVIERQVALIPPTLEERLLAYRAQNPPPLKVSAAALSQAQQEGMTLFQNDLQFDPYRRLGLVNEQNIPNYQASATEIDAAYKRQAYIHHPDRNKGSLQATQTFAEIQRAHEFLTCPVRRSLWNELCYDQASHKETLWAQIRTGDAGIERITQNLAENKKDIAENKKDFAKNKKDFAKNKKDFAKNKKDFAKLDKKLAFLCKKLGVDPHSLADEEANVKQATQTSTAATDSQTEQAASLPVNADVKQHRYSLFSQEATSDTDKGIPTNNVKVAPFLNASYPCSKLGA